MIGGGIGALIQSYKPEIKKAISNAASDIKFPGETVETEAQEVSDNV